MRSIANNQVGGFPDTSQVCTVFAEVDNKENKED